MSRWGKEEMTSLDRFEFKCVRKFEAFFPELIFPFFTFVKSRDSVFSGRLLKVAIMKREDWRKSCDM